ncbi:MAG: T9SS type A sorting domain-containing protein, partial [Bacteroidota bacterium]
WQTSSEQNNKGFYIERMAEGNAAATWETVAFVPGTGNSATPSSYSYTDHLSKPGKYNYRLKQVDLDNKYSYSNIKTIDYNAGMPATAAVYPNPVNSKTMLTVSLNQTADISVHITDATGKLVKTINRKSQAAGDYQQPLNIAGFVKGIYFCQVAVTNAGSNKLLNKTIKLVVN